MEQLKKCPKCGGRMNVDYEFDYYPGTIDLSMACKAFWNCNSCDYKEIIWDKTKKGESSPSLNDFKI